MDRKRLYLAGPGVFLHDQAAIFAAKKKLCRAYDFEGVRPVEKDPPEHLHGAHAALWVRRENLEILESCWGVIANCTPFRGISADVGTAYEMGYAAARSMPVFAYSNEYRSLSARMHCPRGGYAASWPASSIIEDFDTADNAMLVGHEQGGVMATPNYICDASMMWSHLGTFEDALKRAQALAKEW